MKIVSLKKIGFVGIGNLLSTVLGLALLTATARNLSVSDFGKYALLTTLLVGISKISDFGTNSIFVTKTIFSGEKATYNKFFSAKILLLLFSMPIGLFLMKVLNIFTKETAIIFLLGLIAYAGFYFLYAIFQYQQMYSKIVLSNFLPALIKGIASVFILFGILKIDLNIAFAFFSLSIFSSFIMFIFVRKEIPKINFSYPLGRETIKESFSAGTSQLIYEGWPLLTNSATKFLNDFSQTGIFSLANKLARVFSIISLSIFTVLLPKNAAQKKEDRKFDFVETIYMSLGVALLALLTIAVLNVFLIPIFGSQYEGSSVVLSILVFAASLTAIQNFTEHFFYIEQKTNYILYINLCKLLIFVALILMSLNNFTIRSVAMADFVSSSVSLALTFAFIKILKH